MNLRSHYVEKALKEDSEAQKILVVGEQGDGVEERGEWKNERKKSK